MGLADLVAPEAPPHGDDGELGQDDGPPDGGGHLLAALDAEAHVAVVVADGCAEKQIPLSKTLL